MILGAGIFSLALAALLFYLPESEVTLVIDGVPRQVRTRARTVADLLAREGIEVAPGDLLTPGPEEPLGSDETVTLETARPVLIWSDGAAVRILSTALTASGLLEQAGLELSPGDRLLLDGQAVDPQAALPRSPAYTFQIRHASPVRITDQGRIKTIYSTAATLGEALWEAGYRLREADRTSLPLKMPLAGPLEVTLERAAPITIVAGSASYQAYTTATSVGEALAQAGFPLQGLDYSVPGEGSPLPADGRIELVRVHEAAQIDQELLPFESEFGPDPEMPIDSRGITQPGVYGVDAARTRIRYENGQEVWRRAEDSWTALEPQAQLMGYGTKIEVKTIDTPQGVLEYWRAAPMYATSYSPCRIFRDRCDSVTASGATLQHGVAAVSLRHYGSMAGSRVYVPGYGIAAILDVGGGIPGRSWIDLGYSDESYISWHQWVTVYFLTPVPPEGLILYDLN